MTTVIEWVSAIIPDGREYDNIISNKEIAVVWRKLADGLLQS